MPPPRNRLKKTLLLSERVSGTFDVTQPKLLFVSACMTGGYLRLSHWAQARHTARGILRRTPPSDMWCRSPAPQRWLCLGCWTVRTGSRLPAPPAPETTPEHLTAEQSGKEGLNTESKARWNLQNQQKRSLDLRWDLQYRRSKNACCSQKVSRSSSHRFYPHMEENYGRHG